MPEDKNKRNKPDSEERLEDHEAELAAQEAEIELREEVRGITESEYQKMAADLRWEVLEYVDANPDKSVIDIARLFGLKEGTIRAWKAHRTMGTYRQGAGNGNAGRRASQADLFEEPKPGSGPGFLERKRYSNFIHYFDKTPPGIVCPHFFILAHANGCPFACDYCYLRLTLRHYPEPTVFSNTARLFQELRDWLLATEDPSVLNTGELCDSLAWDHETFLATNLISLFQAQKKHKLLFLTKSTAIDNLLELEPCPQVIVSFSTNAEEVAKKYERGAPPPPARLDAARKLKQKGWEVRIRIDPMVPVPDWKDHYARLIESINQIGPSVVTLGSLRYFKNLLAHAPESTDVFSFGKDHGDPDARLRIPIETRIEMYRFCIDRLQGLRIGLCKEIRAVHRELDLPAENQSCNCTVE